MYNRYIPQSDGSYRRSSMPEHPPKSQPVPPPPPKRDPVPEPQPECRHCPQQVHREVRKERSATDFLRNLLPRGLDTEDLLILVLLLLMSGEDRNGNNLPLLTLALYLFL